MTRKEMNIVLPRVMMDGDFTVASWNHISEPGGEKQNGEFVSIFSNFYQTQE